jgi:predicted amidohydrolase
MRLALAQMKMSSDKTDNLIHSLKLLETAAGKQADLILYPEVQLSPFFAQFPANPGGCCGGLTGPEAITEDDPVFQTFRELCRQNHIMASPNFYFQAKNERTSDRTQEEKGSIAGGKKYDASFLIDREGRVIGCQKMVHVAQAPLFYEQDYYTPSDDGFHVYETEGMKTGIVVCFDRHYPESIRTEALLGAELILIPTANVKSEPMEMFEQEIRVQAYQNCCYIAMCNRVGKEAAMDFAGESLIVDPNGNVIAKAGAQEELLIADLDPEKARDARRQRPYLNLRRPEFYA